MQACTHTGVSKLSLGGECLHDYIMRYVIMHMHIWLTVCYAKSPHLVCVHDREKDSRQDSVFPSIMWTRHYAAGIHISMTCVAVTNHSTSSTHMCTHILLDVQVNVFSLQ